MTNSLLFNNELNPSLLESRIKTRKDDFRSSYFRDATAIIHSYPFRRLKHKTQVFFAPKNDHICTRIEHVLHVSTIAATICRSLSLDSDLAWAIGLGHDLGHTPFGHLGEEILTELSSKKNKFHHEIYSLKIVDYLANYGKGLNLTYAVRDGIVNHCGEKFEQQIIPDFKVRNLNEISDKSFYPCTWEGVVVRMSDKIAYLGRDYEDALNLGLIKSNQLPDDLKKIIGDSNTKIINKLVSDLVESSLKNGTISFSNEVYGAFLEFIKFNYKNIYKNERMVSYHDYFIRILKTIYDYLSELTDKYGFNYDKYSYEKNLLAIRFCDYIKKMDTYYTVEKNNMEEAIIDYLAGMTDEYAIDSISEIMLPSSFKNNF